MISTDRISDDNIQETCRAIALRDHAGKEHPQLDQEATGRLTDFARACKAAARAVTLYPSTHPAIRLSMARLVDAAGRMTAGGAAALGVTPDNLLLNGAGDRTARSGCS